MQVMSQNKFNVWNKISGWKTYAGAILHAVWFVYYMFIDQVDTEMQWRGHAVIGLLTGTGLAHKAYKNKETIQKLIKK